MYSLPTYFRDVWPILAQYKADNTWFRWPQDDVSVLNGWRMYRTSSANALGFLLLGDTAIRSDKALMFNFGLTSAHGVQEQKEVDTVAELMGKRRAVAAPGVKPVEMLGPGSILSDKDWSPLLNDSFVLGGVNGCQEFHLADDAFHTFNPNLSIVAQRRAVFGEAAAPYAKNITDPMKEKWQAYFKATPTVFWGPWGPRVFAREVIGMMTFGYKPIFHKAELGFVCVDKGKASSATFREYVSALSASGLIAYDKPKLLNVISEYLFGAKGLL